MSTDQSDLIFQASNLTLMSTSDYADDCKQEHNATWQERVPSDFHICPSKPTNGQRLLMPPLVSDTWICRFFLNLFGLEAEAASRLSWWTAGCITHSHNLIIHSFTVKWTARSRSMEMRTCWQSLALAIKTLWAARSVDRRSHRPHLQRVHGS